MKPEQIQSVKAHAHYILLKRERNRLSIILSSLLILIYFSFILTVAFFPSILATPIYEGSVISIGIPIGISIIVISFIFTGYYVYRANTLYDNYTAIIHKDAL